MTIYSVNQILIRLSKMRIKNTLDMDCLQEVRIKSNRTHHPLNKI